MKKHLPIVLSILTYVISGAFAAGTVYLVRLWSGDDQDFPWIFFLGWSTGSVVLVPLFGPLESFRRFGTPKNGARGGDGSRES